MLFAEMEDSEAPSEEMAAAPTEPPISAEGLPTLADTAGSAAAVENADDGGCFADIDVALMPFVSGVDQDDDSPMFSDDDVIVQAVDENDADILRPSESGRSVASSGKGAEGTPAPGGAHGEISATKAAFHIFKGNVGAAVFSLAGAYRKSGFIAGTVIIVFLACVCVYCMVLLVRCKQKLKSAQVTTYGHVACAAFGRTGKHVVDVFIVITQLGFCCVYYQFAAGMLSSVLHLPVSVWIILVVPITTFPTFLPSMKTLVPAAVFASAATALSLLVVYGYSARSIVLHGPDSEVVPVTSPWRWPVCLGNTVSAFEGIGLVLPIENSLKGRERFPSLLGRTFVGITTLYVSFGLAGYVAFNSVIDSDKAITSVLPEEFLSTLVRLLMAIAILLTYPLQFFPAVQVIEGWCFQRMYRYHALQASVRGVHSWVGKLKLVWRNLLLRVAVSCLLALLAAAVGDKMSLFLALIGGMGGAALAIVIPPLLHLKLFVFSADNADKASDKCAAARDIALTLFGVTVGVLSTVFSMQELIASFTHETPAPQSIVLPDTPVPS